MRTQVTLRTAFTVCFAVVATAAVVLFVLETRLALTLTVAAMMVAIALDHVVRRMEARGTPPRVGHRSDHAGGGAAHHRPDADRRPHGGPAAPGVHRLRAAHRRVHATLAALRGPECALRAGGADQGCAVRRLRDGPERGEPHPLGSHLGAERGRRIRDRAGPHRGDAGVRRWTGAAAAGAVAARGATALGGRSRQVLPGGGRLSRGSPVHLLDQCDAHHHRPRADRHALLPAARVAERVLQPRALRRADPHRRVRSPWSR